MATGKAKKQNLSVVREGLAVEHITYEVGRRRIVRDVSLHVRRGEVVALLGPNGAGKTSTFHSITGVVRSRRGTVWLDGYDVTGLPMYRRSRLGLGYLPQESSIFRGMSVSDNIMAILEIVESDALKRRTTLDELLAEFSISHLAEAESVSLSGGERRRLEIARCLASEPRYMLLDEPLAGIDPIAVNDIRHLVARLKNRGLGVLITDHNVQETLAISDRAYIIHDGTILREGTPDDIIKDETVRSVYLGDDFSPSHFATLRARR